MTNLAKIIIAAFDHEDEPLAINAMTLKEDYVEAELDGGRIRMTRETFAQVVEKAEEDLDIELEAPNDG